MRRKRVTKQSEQSVPEYKPKYSAKKPTRPRKSFARAFFGAFFLIFVIIFCAGVIGALLAPTDKQDSRDSSSKAKITSIGQPTSDAGFRFVVNSIKCGETHIQTSGYVYTYSDAQGQFCRLNITITNISNSANSIGVSAQYLFNSQGQKYDSDSGATATAADALAGSPLNAEVNPSNSVTGDIIYDVPVGVTPTVAELHGDYGSVGVRINLQ